MGRGNEGGDQLPLTGDHPGLDSLGGPNVKQCVNVQHNQEQKKNVIVDS